MKKLVLLAVALMTISGMAMAQEAESDNQVFFVCEVAPGDLPSAGVNEKLTTIVFQSPTQGFSKFLVNDAVFDENSREEDRIVVPFDNVQPAQITDPNEVLGVLLDANWQDIINAAAISDISAIQSIIAFQGSNSQQQNLQMLTVLFLGEDDLLGSAIAFGQDAAACSVPEAPEEA